MAITLQPRPLGRRPYNPAAYVRGGAPLNVAKATQALGYATATNLKPAAPRPPVQAQQPANAPSTSSPAQAPTVQQAYDASTDPILQQIRALTGKGRAAAESGAAAARKQLAIQYGDDTLARLFGDDNTATAARNNPFSVAAELARAYKRNDEDIVENYNKRNLFYSGARGKAHSREAEDYQRRTFMAESEKQQRLAAIQAELMQQLLGYDREDIEGLQGAYGRASDRALQFGIDPGAGATGASGVAGPASTPAPSSGVTDFGFGPAADYQGAGIPAAVLEELLAGRPAVRSPRQIAI